MGSPPQALREFLAQTPFFGGLAEPSLDRIVGMMIEKQFEVGREVFRERETGRSMYVVHEGLLVACQSLGGKTIRLRHFRPGDFFGEMTLIEMQPRPYTVSVERVARLLELTSTDLHRLYREDEKAYVLVLQNINRELCRRLRTADSRLAQLADAAGDEATQIGSLRKG